MPTGFATSIRDLVAHTPERARPDGVKPTAGAPARAPAKAPARAPSRTRRYLTPDEVKQLVEAAARSACPERNRLLVLTMYRHGLRVSEATGLRWLDLDLRRRIVQVRRLKGGRDAVHTLQRDEVEALERLRGGGGSAGQDRGTDGREHGRGSAFVFVFVSRRGDPLSSDAVQKLVREAGEAARLGMRVFPHMLRHACGHALADRGLDTRRIQDFLGHQDIRHTVRYTELAPGRLADILL